MNHVSIFEKKWLDLVFEGKNKNYGAYRLRQEHPRTSLTALFFGLLLVSGIAGIFALSSLLHHANFHPLIENPYTIHPINYPPQKPNIQKAAAPIQKPKQDEPKKNLPLVASKTPDPENPPKNTDPKPENTTPNDGGKVPTTTPGTGTIPLPTVEMPGGDGPTSTALLDKLPEFPGGMNKFYKYVGDKFEKPEINDARSIRLFVSFVIEKDGSMTDIKVARDPGYGLGKEAIRVLKSLKVKWEPGMIAGKPVRTAYNLPITVNME